MGLAPGVSTRTRLPRNPERDRLPSWLSGVLTTNRGRFTHLQEAGRCSKKPHGGHPPGLEGLIVYRTRAVMSPFAACERLRLLAPEAPGAHQAPRRGFVASWRSRKRLEGSRRQRELAAPASLARRRTHGVRRGGAACRCCLRPRSARTASRRGGGSASPTSQNILQTWGGPPLAIRNVSRVGVRGISL